MRLKNNNSPRITRMYGEKNSPREGNIIPHIVEARIENESTSRILVSKLVNYNYHLLHFHKYLSIIKEKIDRYTLVIIALLSHIWMAVQLKGKTEMDNGRLLNSKYGEILNIRVF